MNKLRVMIADDERPARMFLKVILSSLEDVEIVGGQAKKHPFFRAFCAKMRPKLGVRAVSFCEKSPNIRTLRLFFRAVRPRGVEPLTA